MSSPINSKMQSASMSAASMTSTDRTSPEPRKHSTSAATPSENTY